MRLIYSLSIDGSTIEGGGCRGKSQPNGGGERLRQRRRGSWIFYNMGSCAVMSWIGDSPFDRHPIKKKKWYDKSIKKCPFRKCKKPYAKGGIFNSNARLPPHVIVVTLPSTCDHQVNVSKITWWMCIPTIAYQPNLKQLKIMWSWCEPTPNERKGNHLNWTTYKEGGMPTCKKGSRHILPRL